MFEQISILLPFKSDNGIRSAILQWVERFYKQTMPGAEVIISENFDEPFNRCKAINAAARKATRSVYVLADCDVIYPSDLIAEALQLLPQVPWIIPFNRVLDVSEKKTKRLIKKEPVWPIPALEEHCTEGYMDKKFAGKINIFTKQAFEEAGGYDERFIGWGGEDDAFFMAMNTLCGPFARMDKTIYHLWHPHLGADSNPYYNENLKLLRSYRRAKGDREAMQRVVGKLN